MYQEGPQGPERPGERQSLRVKTKPIRHVNLKLDSPSPAGARSHSLDREASPNKRTYEALASARCQAQCCVGHFHTEPKGPSDPFFASNYLFDDRLYSQLSQLAKGSRIRGLQLDLRHENEVRSFCEELKSRGLTLGVIDTSDVPNASETRVAAQYVKLISQYAPDSAIFLNTAQTGGQGVHWSYFAFSNGKIPAMT